MSAGHTPGPWRWEVNRHGKIVHLCGGKPKYDWTVLSFERYGMHNAAPVFWTWGSVGEPRRADELAVEVPGRDHHSAWFADIDHPDARLIAAAPELLEALEGLRAFIGIMCGIGQDCIIPEEMGTPLGVPVKIGAMMRDASAAIAKATGAA